MPFYFRFGIGPLRFSQRLGRTQAQKRAAAKYHAQAAQDRAQRRAAREAQRPEVIAAEQARMEEFRRKHEEAIDAELEEYRQQLRDHDARTYRYRVTKCSIDAIKGGEFTLEAEGLDPVHIRLDAKSAVHFLSLKAGDIVQVTLAPANAALEEFWHISRANGAKPRPPIELTAADMRRLGLTANRSESGG